MSNPLPYVVPFGAGCAAWIVLYGTLVLASGTHYVGQSPALAGVINLCLFWPIHRDHGPTVLPVSSLRFVARRHTLLPRGHVSSPWFWPGVPFCSCRLPPAPACLPSKGYVLAAYMVTGADLRLLAWSALCRYVELVVKVPKHLKPTSRHALGAARLHRSPIVSASACAFHQNLSQTPLPKTATPIRRSDWVIRGLVP
jgi:hypothetical protein